MSYRIAAGDDLDSIARHFSTTVSNIAYSQINLGVAYETNAVVDLDTSNDMFTYLDMIHLILASHDGVMFDTYQETYWQRDGSSKPVDFSDESYTMMTVDLRDGDDVFKGADGWTTAKGGDGNDQIAGGSWEDDLYGQSGADTLRGGGEDDLLVGGSGSDILIGGSGENELEGGNGSDTFIFNQHTEKSTITDFVSGNDSGHDVIDLTAVDAITDIADLKANHLTISNGEAVIAWAGGHRVTIEGITSASQLTNADFIFH